MTLKQNRPGALAGARGPGDSFSAKSSDPQFKRDTSPRQSLPRLAPIWSDDRRCLLGWEATR